MYAPLLKKIKDFHDSDQKLTSLTKTDTTATILNVSVKFLEM